MNWLRYIFLVSAIILGIPSAYAGLDPIGWDLIGVVPKTTILNQSYPGFTYVFKSNLPFTMPTPLFINKEVQGEFIAVDNCTGLKLAPGQSCTVVFSPFTPITLGPKTIKIRIEYGHNVVPLPKVVTTTVPLANFVLGSVPVRLPISTATGSAYPVTFRFTNIGNGTVTGVTYTPNYPPQFTEITNTCNATVILGPGVSCTVTGSFEATTPGTYTVAGTLNYNGGSTTVQTSTISSVKVIGLVPQPLPGSIGTGSSYPVTFSFTNSGDRPVLGVTPATVAVTTGTGNFTITNNTCTGPTLGSGQTCSITGNFIATAPGTVGVTATFHYDGGDPSITTASIASLQVVGTATTPLPPQVGTGSTYNVAFTFTNNASQPANNVVVSAAKISGNGTYTPNPGATTCPTIPSQLPAGGSCVIAGTYQTNVAGGLEAVQATLNFDGGVVQVTTSGTGTLLVTGSPTTPLPAQVGTGNTYNVVFTFMNNATAPAQNVLVSVAKTSGNGGPPTIVPGGTTCPYVVPGTLAASSSCTIEVTYGTVVPGATETLEATLTFDGGVVQTSTSGMGARLISGAVTQGLPPQIATATDYTVVFTFTNNATEDTPNVSFNAVKTSGNGTFTIVPGSTTCPITPTTFTFAAGSQCQITGTYSTNVAGATEEVTATAAWIGGPATVSTSGTGTALVQGSATTPLPPQIGTTSTYPVVFTWVNNGPSTVTVAITNSMTSGSGTYTPNPGGTTCPAVPGPLAPGMSCTVAGTYITNTAGGTETITSTAVYAGGSPTATTTSTGAVMVIGTTPLPLPAATTIGDPYAITFRFTNTAPQAAAGIMPAVVTADTAGIITPGTNTCTGPTLGAGASCDITLTFQPAAGPNTVTATFQYPGGTPTATTTTTATFAPISMTGTVVKKLPPTIGTGKPGAPFKFSFHNGTDKKVDITTPTLTVTPATGSFTLDRNGKACGMSIKSLAPGASCDVSGMFIANATGEHALDITVNYNDGKAIKLNTTTNAGRVFTIKNNCRTDVWFSFNGDVAKQGCKNDVSCPQGSVCVSKADNGKGICYWTNPLPEDKKLKLAMGTSTQVIVPDMDKTSSTIWSGSIAGRTGCVGDSCETADCASAGGDKACPPGSPFARPATVSKMTLSRSALDTYHVETMLGVNLAMAVGPSNAHTCVIAGDNRGDKDTTCHWNFITPTVDYIWVKAATGKPVACTSNEHCLTHGEVCGLSYSAQQRPNFQRICGTQLGYWTAKEACALNAMDAETFFGCNTKTAALAWLKAGCQSAVTSADDLKSKFSCESQIGNNVTDYTVTFCPA